jgi:hypothetical protein
VTGTEQVIRWSTAGAVLGAAAVAATESYEHAYELVKAPKGSRLDCPPSAVDRE